MIEQKPWTYRHLKALKRMREVERQPGYSKQDKPLIRRINKAISWLEKRAAHARRLRKAALAIEQAVTQP